MAYRNKLELKIYALLLCSEITQHEPTRKEIVRELNFYNLQYAKKYGEFYKPNERRKT